MSSTFFSGRSFFTYFINTCLLCVALCACDSKKQTPQQSPVIGYEIPVLMDIPVKASWVGHLDGVNNASIVPQVTGYLQSQDYTNGALVQQGELLFKINDATFKDEVAKAQATLAQAQAQLKQLNYDVQVYKPLVAQNAIAKQKYEDTLLSAQSAAAQVQQATAALALAKKDLSYTVLTAPFTGIAGIAKANIGDLVSPQSGALTVVSSVNPIRVNFAVTQQEWLQQAGKDGTQGVQPGSKLAIQLKDGSTYPHQATVVDIDRSFNPQTGTIQVQADLPNDQYVLRPGMFVIATAQLSTVHQALTVPIKAVLSTQGRFFVVVLDERNHPSIVPVLPGTQIGNRQQITPVQEGAITAQSKIVVDGILQAEAASRTPDSTLNAVLNSNK